MLFSTNILLFSRIINPAVIKQRNRINAISVMGLVASWLLQMWYLFIAGDFEGERVREREKDGERRRESERETERGRDKERERDRKRERKGERG